MPTIAIKRKYFYSLLGKTLTDEELDQFCFDYGLESEEDKDCPENLKVELPANRYDLLCVEGLALAFQSYLGLAAPKTFKVHPPQHTLTIEPSVKGVRPFCVSGIIRNVTLCQEAYESFIDFQDKLHHNLGRRRTLVSIGTHDYDKTKAPYFYRAKKRDEFSFVSLNQKKEMRGDEMLEFYKKDLNLKSYVDIIESSELVPLIMDSTGAILSLPPIINSDLTKISTATKNIFIDITANDKTKALMALSVLCESFSLYSSTPCEFEAVEIIDGEEKFPTPDLKLTRTIDVQREYLESVVGVPLSDPVVKTCLEKMGMTLTKKEDNVFTVTVPFYRTDIMHQCDIAEDVAIGYGFNSIPFLPSEVNCLGEQNKLNKLTEQMREELAFLGFCESLNFSLCSTEDLTAKLKRESDPCAVVIDNPKTLDFQVGRTTLLPGLLKSLASNKQNKTPFKFFELGDVILLDDKGSADELIGARNERRLALLYSNASTSGLDVIHGVLDSIVFKLYKNAKQYSLK